MAAPFESGTSRAPAAGAEGADAAGRGVSTRPTTPRPTKARPAPKPTLLMLAIVNDRSRSGCALGGQAPSEAQDFFAEAAALSETIPVIDPTTRPAAPRPRLV